MKKIINKKSELINQEDKTCYEKKYKIQIINNKERMSMNYVLIIINN